MLTITAAQFAAMADWVETSIEMPADVELSMNGSILHVAQGDNAIAFLANGTDTIAHDFVCCACGTHGADKHTAVCPLRSRAS